MLRLNRILGIDREQGIVHVQGGVRTHALMEYLAQHGYVLKGVPYWIEQSIAGAVATSTHGSDLRSGRDSLSSMVKEMHIVLSNGSVAHFTRDRDPEAMRATKVGVGKLGVTYQLSLEIEPDYRMRGSIRRWSENRFLEWLSDARERGTNYFQDEALRQTGLNIFWFPIMGMLSGNQHIIVDTAVDTALFRASMKPTVLDDGPNSAVHLLAQCESGNVADCPPGMRELLDMYIFERYSFCSGDCLASADMVTNHEAARITEPRGAYDQYEFAFPLQKAHECLSTLMTDVVPGYEARRRLFSTPILMRFMAETDSYLGLSEGGARMLLNFNIDLARRRHEVWECRQWDDVVAHFLGHSCAGRHHWGKTGWEHVSAEDAHAMFPQLGLFKKVMHAWDPTGKFRGSQPVWAGGAVRRGRCEGSGARCSEAAAQASTCMCTAGGDYDQCQWVPGN
mmetsp:Transcript_65184/g.212334  ORF Transcript_65184/g.212334 Transcript_65184/m.212334 type:complete len:451 (-) Transcript_65184:117-1469(-)